MGVTRGTAFDRLIPVVSIALGIGSRIVDSAGLRWAGNIAALWFLAAFVIGRRQTSVARAASAGIITLFLATLAYYAWRLGIDGTISTRYLRTVGAAWFLGAVLVGALAGWAGFRSRGASAFWGTAAGVFLGEAIAVALLRQRWIQVAVEILIGGVLLSRARPQIHIGLAFTTVSGALVFAIALAYRMALR